MYFQSFHTVTQWHSFFSFRGTLSAFSNAPGTLSTRLGNGNTTLLASGGGNSNQAPPGAGAAAVLHRRSSPNSSSAYSQSQWRVQKDNMSGVGRCSWKFVAIFFMLLSVILVSALIYTTGKICSTSANLWTIHFSTVTALGNLVTHRSK